MTLGKKSVAIAGLLAAIGAGAVGVGTTFAASSTPATPHDRMEALVSAIATKFNLSTTDVQAVFDAQHATDVAAHKQHMIDGLAKAVTDGKLTQSQSDLLQAKATTEQSFMESLKAMTPDQREAAVKTERAALEQWAKDNGLSKEFARFLPLVGAGERRMEMRHDRKEDRKESRG